MTTQASSTSPLQRRASYGPTSPTVGQRGARTRERIVAETLNLFAHLGFHETTVRDISDAAEISRATLYQYFESKDEIFVELLDECGGALMAVMRNIGPLGPTQPGLDNLREWLVKWTEVYEKYGTLFVQWANVDLPGTAVSELVTNFLRSYNLRIANRLRRSGLTGMDARDAAVVTTCIIHRFNYVRFVSPLTQPSVEEAVRDISIVLQAILFPATPSHILGGVAHEVSSAACRHPQRRSGKLATVDRGMLEGLTARSAATVDQIMRAGAECFADSGYYRANVDDIVKRAGFARGTFYKYFSEKLDLLLVLSDQCEARLVELTTVFTEIPAGADGAELRRQWIADYLEFRTRYIGVIRTWVDRAPANPTLDQTRSRMTKLVHATLDSIVGDGPLAGVVSVRAAEIMFTGVLERLPDEIPNNARPARRAKMIELIAATMERGLFGLDAPVSATGR